MLSQLSNLDWHQIVTHLWHLVFAYLLAIPIGLDREKSQRQFGLRTFPLVAVVACGFMMVGMSVVSSTDGEARIFQGIITGIGFIGGGAIFKDKDRVAGTASAASIWNTGAIGIAVAFDRFEVAIVLSLLNFFTLWAVGRLKHNVADNSQDE
ncbi:MAG: MgtC/SapB family protein [Desulfobacterales bacterium]|jgi:putative Mg2+ transporter-C (MgtC) family protein